MLSPEKPYHSHLLHLLAEIQWYTLLLCVPTDGSHNIHHLLPFRNVKDVRTLGAVGVAELASTPSPETVQRIVRETGVWLRPFGPWLYTMPPFVASPEELTRITRAMRAIALA